MGPPLSFFSFSSFFFTFSLYSFFLIFSPFSLVIFHLLLNSSILKTVLDHDHSARSFPPEHHCKNDEDLCDLYQEIINIIHPMGFGIIT